MDILNNSNSTCAWLENIERWRDGLKLNWYIQQGNDHNMLFGTLNKMDISPEVIKRMALGNVVIPEPKRDKFPFSLKFDIDDAGSDCVIMISQKIIPNDKETMRLLTNRI